MSQTSVDNVGNPGPKAYRHAIVIGSGIAGLLAARVLCNHFDRVTIIERDRMPKQPEYRKGTPHGRQPHIMLLRGEQILEQLFPGYTQTLLDQGAVRINGGSQVKM